MVIYLLDNSDIPYEEEGFIEEDLPDYPSNDVLTAIFNHPRIAPMVENTKNTVLRLLITGNREGLVDWLLDHYNIDVSVNNYEAVFEAIEVSANNILKTLLDRPEIESNARLSLRMLTSVNDGNTLNVLLDHDKIILTENSSIELIDVFIGVLNYVLVNILSHEKVVINEEVAKKVLSEALALRNGGALKTLVNHPRTMEYYNEDDLQLAEEVLSKISKQPKRLIYISDDSDTD